MNTSRFVAAMIIVASLFVIFGCGDDDKSNNPSYTTPSQLVGTWWYHSAFRNGVPVSSYSQISYTGHSDTSFNTFSANDTWAMGEYDNDSVVYTQTGSIIVDGDTMTIQRLTQNGVPVTPPDTFVFAWEIQAETLRLSNNLILGNDTIFALVNYIKE